MTQVSRPNIEGSPFLDACLPFETAEMPLQGTFRKPGRWRPDAAAKRGTVCGWSSNRTIPENGTVHPRFNSWNAEAMLRAILRRRKDRRFLESRPRHGACQCAR